MTENMRKLYLERLAPFVSHFIEKPLTVTLSNETPIVYVTYSWGERVFGPQERGVNWNAVYNEL